MGYVPGGESMESLLKSLLGKGQQQVYATATMQTLIENAEKKENI